MAHRGHCTLDFANLQSAANTVSSRNRYSGESGQGTQLCDLRYFPCAPMLFRRSPRSRDRMWHE